MDVLCILVICDVKKKGAGWPRLTWRDVFLATRPDAENRPAGPLPTVTRPRPFPIQSSTLGRMFPFIYMYAYCFEQMSASCRSAAGVAVSRLPEASPVKTHPSPAKDDRRIERTVTLMISAALLRTRLRALQEEAARWTPEGTPPIRTTRTTSTRKGSSSTWRRL